MKRVIHNTPEAPDRRSRALTKTKDFVDQRDYTTPEGDHVKIPVAYDYVYQNGSSVFYTNDALSIPAGATMLNPK